MPVPVSVSTTFSCLDSHGTRAYEWYRKGADAVAPDPGAVCGLAHCLLDGKGVTQDVPNGFFYLGRATEMGVEHAYYLMGWYHKEGRHGLSKDNEAIRKWFRKMSTATVRNSPQTVRDEVAQWLRENS